MIFTCRHERDQSTVPPVLTDHLGTHGRWLDDRGCWMVGVSVVGTPQHPSKKYFNIVGDIGGSRMCVYLQCEFDTKMFYKPSVFVFSIPTINY